MSAGLGWALAALAVAVAWWQYGWPGVGLAVSAIVFWLLLQFSRVLRVMRDAGLRPVGRVPNAVMLQARLRPGMRLIDVIPLTGSLGEALPATAPSQEGWAWQDAAGDRVELTLERGRLTTWSLRRAALGDQVDGASDGRAPSPPEGVGPSA